VAVPQRSFLPSLLSYFFCNSLQSRGVRHSTSSFYFFLRNLKKVGKVGKIGRSTATQGLLAPYLGLILRRLPADRHAELLAEIEASCETLRRLISAERNGVFDGFGQDFWVDSDPILSTVKAGGTRFFCTNESADRPPN
jgi:hypothetical protein